MSLLAADTGGVDIGKAFKIGSESIGTKTGYSSIGAFVSTILPNVYIVAGIILFFLFILGGFSIITSSGDPEKTKQGQQTLMAAIVGFVLVFASYWIIQIIEVLTGVKIFMPNI
ncbi:hypothetical protein A2160_00695 [Candidatus Beckwithbacteria bacterium RBG_13_42_9]|uniref:Uncharacterized protein n=1 Tax=Candidatus Beckwithbacteria bacterium RBG_13_42_9 TaxID=1797457 RepID=A0A1F5E4K2_9BACT|nr:MAG: hypothetical protein A2160_00695 [Candidatus Beckwithbacteria bacterium RBG_13_42_9]